MKRSSILLLGITLFFSLALFAQKKDIKEKKQPGEDVLKNFSLVDKTIPVPADMKAGFDSITTRDAAAYLGFLSSDLLEGRDTASRGYQIASEYVASMFAKWGLKAAGDMPLPKRRSFFSSGPTTRKPNPKRSYFQNLALKEVIKSENEITITYRGNNQVKELTFFPGMDYNTYLNDNMKLTVPVVFVGFGIKEKSLKFNEYRKLNVKGKYVLMFSEIPREKDKNSPFKKGKLKAKYYPVRRGYRSRGFSKAKIARDMGAAGIILIERLSGKSASLALKTVDSSRISDEKPIIPGKHRRISLLEPSSDMPWRRITTVRISKIMAKKLFSFYGKDLKKIQHQIEKSLKPASFELKSLSMTIVNKVKYKLVKRRNVLGCLEGSDPELKKEIIVIGAHLDHLGKRGDYIYNGADDNGSGSAGVMETAEAFTVNKIKPKRSILFALWTGEEKGLLGSRYYVSHPYFPLKSHKYCINLDMISRPHNQRRLKAMARMMGEKLPQGLLKKIKINNFLTPTFDENSAELYEAIKKGNNFVGLHLMLRKSKGGFGGSDHAPFSMKKIPWAFFMASMTQDYHQPTDSIEKIDFELLRNITRLTYLTAFQLANK